MASLSVKNYTNLGGTLRLPQATMKEAFGQISKYFLSDSSDKYASDN